MGGGCRRRARDDCRSCHPFQLSYRYSLWKTVHFYHYYCSYYPLPMKKTLTTITVAVVVVVVVVEISCHHHLHRWIVIQLEQKPFSASYSPFSLSIYLLAFPYQPLVCGTRNVFASNWA